MPVNIDPIQVYVDCGVDFLTTLYIIATEKVSAEELPIRLPGLNSKYAS